MAENEKETPPFPWTGEQIRAKETCPNCGAKPVEQVGFYLRFECGSDGEFGLPQGEILHGQTETCARLSAAERENERLQTFIDALPEKIRKCGEPGPGGINITNGVPSEVYIAIGRDRYDTEYEVAEATAEAVRTNTADSIPRWLAALTPPAEGGEG
jgi:hypothetical protein